MHQSTGRRRREFERLAKQHQRDLLNAARRLTRTLSDAEDLAQEALIKAYISFDQFELGTNFRAWLKEDCHYDPYQPLPQALTPAPD